jgi:hypothetical protein
LEKQGRRFSGISPILLRVVGGRSSRAPRRAGCSPGPTAGRGPAPPVHVDSVRIGESARPSPLTHLDAWLRLAPGLVGHAAWTCAHVQEVSAARLAGIGFSAAMPVGRVLARHRVGRRHARAHAAPRPPGGALRRGGGVARPEAMARHHRPSIWPGAQSTRGEPPPSRSPRLVVPADAELRQQVCGRGRARAPRFIWRAASCDRDLEG